MVTVLWVIALIYCAIPGDLFPGPIDDAIVFFVIAGITSLTGRIEQKK